MCIFLQIYYKEDTQLHFQSVVTGNVHSYLLTGLSPSISYDIKVGLILLQIPSLDSLSKHYLSKRLRFISRSRYHE